MNWKINFFENQSKLKKLKNPILIEGLPGIGNVGKIVVDFLIDEIKAKKIAEFNSYNLPHSVFVNEKNLVELPMIELYHKKHNGKDLLLLGGDVQPQDEVSCYEFCDKVLELLSRFKCDKVITLGGIALRQEPKNPKVFITGNDKNLIKGYIQGTRASNKLYGVVGPIVGVSGLLLGLAKKRKIKGVSLLAETYGHPLYLGLTGAREILKILKKKLKLKVNIDLLSKEIEEFTKELGKSKKARQARLTKFKSRTKTTDVNYIG